MALKCHNSRYAKNTKCKTSAILSCYNYKHQEMMLELSQHVQSFLYANNKPPPLSFYEQMMSNKQRQEEQEALEQQRKMDLLRRKEEKEVRRLVLICLAFVVFSV